MILNESIVEEAALEWFRELGYAVGHGLSSVGTINNFARSAA